MTQPIVSVLVPCYQDGDYLESTLESILCQSFDDFEIIISDEGVDPKCGEIATRLSERDSRIKYFLNENRLGMTQNWNAAFAKSTGQYIIKLDGDDQFKPQAIEYLVQAFHENPKAAVSACLANDCNEVLECTAGIYGLRGYELAGINPLLNQLLVPEVIYPHLFADAQLWHSCALMFQREILIKLKGWDETWGCASDTDIILRLFDQGFSLAHVGYIGLEYRRRENSVSDQFRKGNKLLWEGVLIHLSSVHRWYKSGRTLTKPLTIGWYRYWMRHKDIKSQVKENESCDQYISISVKGPPLNIRLKEKIRLLLHGVKATLNLNSYRF